ncbi:CAP domain-containing protein [Paenibacillus gorillae]|uniref:CAP domain-containing protein n=1 Tax=Paenibacillus gorillae TaxID=1243662 RepID=UPI0004BA4139
MARKQVASSTRKRRVKPLATNRSHKNVSRKYTLFLTRSRSRSRSRVRISQLADDVFTLTNEARAAAGLRPLKKLIVTTTLPNGETLTTDQLSDIATLKARDMRDNQYFDHTSPTYGSPGEMLTEFGVNWTAYGENIAAGQRTPEAVMQSWLNSPGHRANILNPNFTYLGVGYVPGNDQSEFSTYWTQLFVTL